MNRDQLQAFLKEFESSPGGACVNHGQMGLVLAAILAESEPSEQTDTSRLDFLSDIETVPCETCGKPTARTATRRCDRCWEVEGLLADYLRNGGDKARVFVLKTVTLVDGEP